jgi:hypothetical protein
MNEAPKPSQLPDISKWSKEDIELYITKLHEEEALEREKAEKRLSENFLFAFGIRLFNDLIEPTPDQLAAYHAYLFANPEAAYQISALFVFVSLRGYDSEPKLTRDGNTIWHYKLSSKCWVPFFDITRPDAPFLPIEYQLGNEFIIEKFGTDFEITDSKGKKHYKHFNRSNLGPVRDFFKQYCMTLLPDHPGVFATKKPEKAVSANNGVLRWTDKGFTLEDHSPAHYLTVPAFPFKYIPWAEVPNEKKETLFKYFDFLFRNYPEGEKLQALQLAGFIIGYSLTPYRIKKFPFLLGTNDTGKSLYLRLITRIHAHTQTAAEVDFLKMQTRPSDFDAAAFAGKYVAVHDDFPPGGELPAGMLKKIADENTQISVSEKYKPTFQMMNTATPILSSNDSPQCRDPYIGNRLIAFPFNANFTEDEKTDPENRAFIERVLDPDMLEVFFNFGIECLVQFFRDSATIDAMLPGIVKKNTDLILGKLNDVLLWVKEALEAGTIIEEKGARCLHTELYRAYAASRKNPVSRNSFYSQIRKTYQETTYCGAEMFLGLRVIHNGGGNFDD